MSGGRNVLQTWHRQGKNGGGAECTDAKSKQNWTHKLFINAALEGRRGKGGKRAAGVPGCARVMCAKTARLIHRGLPPPPPRPRRPHPSANGGEAERRRWGGRAEEEGHCCCSSGLGVCAGVGGVVVTRSSMCRRRSHEILWGGSGGGEGREKGVAYGKDSFLRTPTARTVRCSGGPGVWWWWWGVCGPVAAPPRKGCRLQRPGARGPISHSVEAGWGGGWEDNKGRGGWET